MAGFGILIGNSGPCSSHRSPGRGERSGRSDAQFTVGVEFSACLQANWMALPWNS